MGKLGILFDVAALSGGAYGMRAYQTLFKILDTSLLSGCTLSDGDVGNEYCIAIESFEIAKLHQIKSVVFNSNSKGLVPRKHRFLDGGRAEMQPLVTAGFVDRHGNLQGCETWFVQQAWDAAKTKQQQHPVADFASTVSGSSTVAPAKQNKQHSTEHVPGEVFGKEYLVLDVRRGGMGLVYIVEDQERLKEGTILRVAFKTFQAKYLWDSNAIHRFEREALNWVRIGKHTNIVHALVVQQIEAKPYIWLEFVDGMSLAEQLDTKRVEIGAALDIALQFCSGMRYAHENHGLIHRDVKPGNIMISSEGVVKITDFGLSKIQAEFAEAQIRREGSAPNPDNMQTLSNVYQTGTGVCVGTPAYLAPEAILHPDSVDVRADIYSFGIVLYEMLTGDRPFHGPRILEQHVRAAPAAARTLNPDIPVSFERIVHLCLAKDPDRRYQSFAELENELLELAGRKEMFSNAGSQIGEKEQRLLEGFSFMELAKYQDAIRCFHEVLQLDETDEEAYNNIGVCLGNMERFEESVAHLEKAVSIRNEYPEAWANLGGVYYQLKRYEEGLRACNRAILQRPDWAEAHANKGVNLLGLGEFEEAMSCFESAVQADPKYWRAFAHAGEAHARRGNLKEAIEFLSKALAISPRNAYLLALAAACLFDSGRINEAKEFLERARQVDPHEDLVIQVGQLIGGSGL